MRVIEERKREIKLEKENIYITGDSVIIESVTEKELDDYLYIKRYATMIASEFDRLDGFWEYMKPSYIEDLHGPDIICLIYNIKSNKAIGYISFEMKDWHHPKVGIGILEEQREKGYAFEAATLLINKAFEDKAIEYIEWMTTKGNKASNSIARKLGGRIIREEPIVPKEALEHWGEEISQEEIPCYVVYGIYRGYGILYCRLNCRRILWIRMDLCMENKLYWKGLLHDKGMVGVWENRYDFEKDENHISITVSRKLKYIDVIIVAEIKTNLVEILFSVMRF
jgi:RimJ/RimL family protein N-acetyltransferase